MRVAHIQKRNNQVINLGLADELITSDDFYMVEIQDREDVIPGMFYKDGVFEFVEQVEVPNAISARQARRALFEAGILSIVEQFIQNMPGDVGELARIDWEYATEIERTNPLVLALGPSLGLTDEQIDDLFIAGSKI